MSNFYHVFIQTKPGVSTQEVEQTMNKALDWFRYTPSVWYLFSSSTIDVWYERLRPLVEPDGALFICELNMDRRNGRMISAFWDWIKKNEIR